MIKQSEYVVMLEKRNAELGDHIEKLGSLLNKYMGLIKFRIRSQSFIDTFSFDPRKMISLYMKLPQGISKNFAYIRPYNEGWQISYRDPFNKDFEDEKLSTINVTVNDVKEFCKNNGIEYIPDEMCQNDALLKMTVNITGTSDIEYEADNS